MIYIVVCLGCDTRGVYAMKSVPRTLTTHPTPPAVRPHAAHARAHSAESIRCMLVIYST